MRPGASDVRRRALVRHTRYAHAPPAHRGVTCTNLSDPRPAFEAKCLDLPLVHFLSSPVGLRAAICATRQDWAPITKTQDVKLLTPCAALDMAATTTPLQRAKVKLRVIARLQLVANARAAARAAASGAATADTIDEEETYDGSYNNGVNHRRNSSQASTAAEAL